YTTERSNFWLYGVIDVKTGKNLFWEFSSLNKLSFEYFIDEVSKEYDDSFNIILTDNSRVHFLDEYPENIALINIEPYCPELNPAESVWKYFKDSLGYRLFSNIEALRNFVDEKIKNTTLK